ncbi:hypothetical protein [Candidatus Entotheonella palauensis]|uniref:hypothetical protein n=1 Tax=Candidatus Entotheonella palauensis TaxID=93172 RepID=UPI000B7C5895|nr:hypothetical protein [Candidatus Entotheonella palauensis]
MDKDRRQEAYRVRVEAAALARDRAPAVHTANGDEQRLASVNYAMSFTKGLAHDAQTGLVDNPDSFRAFRKAIDDGYVDAFTLRVPTSAQKQRQWEAPTAGVVYDLQGPDCQAVTMAPAPALGSDELVYEMAEVYELALLRDEPLNDLTTGTSNTNVIDTVNRLNALAYVPDGSMGRSRTRDSASASGVSAQTVFRGSSPGVAHGPYLSQFMLIGNSQPCDPGIAHGHIQYGALRIDQRVPVAAETNYMITWTDWLEAQNGRDLRNNGTLFDCSQPRRFITFPRDLATYVHDDALYEAYLNACLILLSMGTPFDPGFSHLSGLGELFLNSLDIATNTFNLETHPRHAGGFALWGGPHILTLVTEVATRALKAVRYQKFNNHLRLRPEALAARVERAADIETQFPAAGTRFSDLAGAMAPTVAAVRAANVSAGSTALLPMAFQEGSPMHPSYGAGHATVAGACVTILKAYFDTGTLLLRRAGNDAFRHHQSGDTAIYYTANSDGSALEATENEEVLTLEGELNKLAANISIGRNMAGVHQGDRILSCP